MGSISHVEETDEYLMMFICNTPTDPANPLNNAPGVALFYRRSDLPQRVRWLTAGLRTTCRRASCSGGACPLRQVSPKSTSWLPEDALRARGSAGLLRRPPSDGARGVVNSLLARPEAQMHYLITGGSGFIGSALCRSLMADGHRATVLTRDIVRARQHVPDAAFVVDRLDFAEDVDAIVNLAGENLASGRWTTARKHEFVASRIGVTKHLLDWIDRQDSRPRVLVSGSAVGWYGPCGDEELDEDADLGNDFSAHLCRDWEAEAIKAEALGVRVCRVRTGIVLGAGGGALKQMLLPFRLGIGGRMGSGRQWMSWIAREDLVALIRWLVDNASARGAYNGTAPTPVTNAEFARALGAALHRPALLPTPASALKLLFGEMADLLLTGQRVVPRRATGEGFAFKYPELPAALAAVLD